jgi:hypothetical protein
MYLSVFRKKQLESWYQFGGSHGACGQFWFLMDGVEEVGDYFPGKCFL